MYNHTITALMQMSFKLRKVKILSGRKCVENVCEEGIILLMFFL